jgi:hypothetical protein
MNPSFAEGHFYLAKLYLDGGLNLDEAERLARKGLELAPTPSTRRSDTTCALTSTRSKGGAATPITKPPADGRWNRTQAGSDDVESLTAFRISSPCSFAEGANCDRVRASGRGASALRASSARE